MSLVRLSILTPNGHRGMAPPPPSGCGVQRSAVSVRYKGAMSGGPIAALS
ncbi:hypothetical protein GFS31_02710 [Leptolyngbya sp. BL0902]|nr:hypothetical protein [Leptolyngbya sp. BL0902]QQE63604.1 hypothetical protein GFS31_02710 [Leptolyngbya sp. BL0902]